jgi:hypothetical protein
MPPRPLTRSDLKKIRDELGDQPEIQILLDEIRRMQLVVIDLQGDLKYVAGFNQDYRTGQTLSNWKVRLDEEWYVRWDRAVQEKKRAKSLDREAKKEKYWS